MTQTRPIQNTFSSSEIDPLLGARNDFQRFQTGLARASGFLPLRQGAFTRAPGTIFRGVTRNNQKAVRIPFEFAVNDTLALEFTHLKMRVWRYGELVTVSGGAPYDLDTPYTEDDLPNLDYVPSSDVIYIADGRQPIQKLSRLALDSWTIEPAEFENGPFRPQNLDKAKRIKCSAAEGSVTIEAEGNVFSPDHVGASFRIEPENFEGVPLWVGNQPFLPNMRVRYDERIYRYLGNNNNTGYSPPTHLEGRALYFPATRWEFESEKYGIVKIDAVIDANEATGTVVKTIPNPAIGEFSYRWSESAWSPLHGFPKTIATYRQRMYAANTDSDPRTVWASIIGLYTDMEMSEDADAAFGYDVAGDGSRNEILWLRGGQRGIYIGALGETYRGFSAAQGQAIGPLTFDIELVDSDGVMGTRPILPYGFPVYISRDGQRVQEVRYSFEKDSSKPLELSLPARHLGASRFQQIVWQSSPHRRAWLRTSDGKLACMIYDPDHDVLGWSPLPVAGGFVEHLDVTVGLEGATDVLTMIVRREIDGQTVRYVEELATNTLPMLGTVPATHFNHAFASMVFEPEAETDSFSLPHLVGQSVWAWTDKGQAGPLTVAGDGAVQLPFKVTRAIIGMADDTHMAETLDLQAAGRNGDTRGRKRRIEGACGVDLYKTADGTVRSVERHFEAGEKVGMPQRLVQRPVASNILDLRTGTRRIDVPSGNADAVRLRFVPEGIAPMTVSAIIPNIDEAGA